MKLFSSFISLVSLFSLSIAISSCGSSGGSNSSSNGTVKVARKSGFNPHHGPFDSRGNYREEWADNPPRRVFTSGSEADNDDDVIAATRPDIPAVATYDTPQPRPTTTRPYTPKPRSNTYYSPTPTTSKKTTVKKTIKKATTYIKPKPVYVKPKPVSKPPIIHVVKSGDTLWGLAQKYKSGVKTIQIANGLQGNVIKIGQSLKIPRF